jgi:predicted P-loop ATPase/GTPase
MFLLSGAYDALKRCAQFLLWVTYDALKLHSSCSSDALMIVGGLEIIVTRSL